MPPLLHHTNTMPVSSTSSRSASLHYLPSDPVSPGVEDLHRFPTESLHSFSFTHQSEDFLHSRQNILKKTIDFMRDRLGWAATTPGLADAQARVSGDSDVQSMMQLLKRANLLSVNTGGPNGLGLGWGPLTGPADVDGANIFEKSFSQPQPIVEEEAISEPPVPQAPHVTLDEVVESPVLEMSSGLENPRSPTAPKRSTLKRTFTDLTSISLQAKLMEALAKPYTSEEQNAVYNLQPAAVLSASASIPQTIGAPSVHSHSSKWAPAAQAVFRTDSKAPWTILAANDLACLIFGVTGAEVRKLGILEVVRPERRKWLEEKLRGPGPDAQEKAIAAANSAMAKDKKAVVGGRGGITALLLNKTPSREQPARRSQTDDGVGGYYKSKTPKNHPATKSRGVLLCGDVVPIQKRNGTTGSASFWVMEKRGGLIWVLEEIIENVAYVKLDVNARVSDSRGEIEAIWGQERIEVGTPITTLFPHVPVGTSLHPISISTGISDISRLQHFTAQTAAGVAVPTSITKLSGPRDLRISSFPHIAGVMVVNPTPLTISSSNAVFSAALFGYEKLDGLPITDLIPEFGQILEVLTEEDDVDLVDGIVIPEHSFRRARALLALREKKTNAASNFFRHSGLPARHRDGSELMVDVQMRIVKSETAMPHRPRNAITEEDEDGEASDDESFTLTEVVYALWVTYSRQLHSGGLGSPRPDPPLLSQPAEPAVQLSPRSVPSASPEPVPSTSSASSSDSSQVSLLTQKLQEAASTNISDEPLEHPPPNVPVVPHKKKTISDFIILEEMGSGAYGQVKLVRYKKKNSRKMVLKYVTKTRILVDTWTRDRRLGTVPLEIHVMDYLRRDGMRHPNIVEMVDFFEDDVNYYIEMVPHGIPGMDLFDYIELRSDMEEAECKNIFRQVVDAIHHLHTKALVVHRDIKDENVVLDGEGKIKLIDFGSAAYVKNGPFDVFVGTIGKHPRTGSPLCIFIAPTDYDQTTQRPRCFKAKPIAEKSKMCGLSVFCSTRSSTRRTHSTTSTKFWITRCEYRSSHFPKGASI
jgi:protein-serine/threonine kinase